MLSVVTRTCQANLHPDGLVLQAMLHLRHFSNVLIATDPMRIVNSNQIVVMTHGCCQRTALLVVVGMGSK